MIFSRIHMNKRVLRRALDEIIPGKWFVPSYALVPAPRGTRGGGAFAVFQDAATAMKAYLVVNVTSSVEIDDEQHRKRALYGRMNEFYPWEDAPNRELPHDGYLIVKVDDTIETATFVPLGRQLTFKEICEILGSRARALGNVRLQGHRGELYSGDKSISTAVEDSRWPENQLGSRLGRFGRFADRRIYSYLNVPRLHGTILITIGRAR